MTFLSDPPGPPGAASPIDLDAVYAAYHTREIDIAEGGPRVRFGISGHCGSSLDGTFTEAHVLAVVQAICDYRGRHHIAGPLFLGKDTHALSGAAFPTVLAVLAANAVRVMVDERHRFTPTPAIAHAILRHNRRYPARLADGIVLTASHRPPDHGGVSYLSPMAGPAESAVTQWINQRANALMARRKGALGRVISSRVHDAHTMPYDYLGAYVDDLAAVIDTDAVAAVRLAVGVEPLGGGSTEYWERIAERFGLDLRMVNATVDQTFPFVPRDEDGMVQLNCTSRTALATLIDRMDEFDIACAADPDAARHGIVTSPGGLMSPHRYLVVALTYLMAHRPGWRTGLAIGKSAGDSQLINRAAARVGRAVVEVPAGFRWFAPGLLVGALGCAGDERGGASLLRRDGTAWTTAPDGIAMGLLAAEIVARTGRNPRELSDELIREIGPSWYEVLERPIAAKERRLLQTVAPPDVRASVLAGDPVVARVAVASGNGARLDGVKVSTAHGWFAACATETDTATGNQTASGYTLYAESFRSAEHLHQLQREAEGLTRDILARSDPKATQSRSAS